MSELNAAGITDPQLRASYSECKRLNSLHGKTYYLATLLLPAKKRPFVHALYGFARYADEIVDDLNSTLSDDEKSKALKQWGDGVLSDIKTGQSHDHIGAGLLVQQDRARSGGGFRIDERRQQIEIDVDDAEGAAGVVVQGDADGLLRHGDVLDGAKGAAGRMIASSSPNGRGRLNT